MIDEDGGMITFDKGHESEWKTSTFTDSPPVFGFEQLSHWLRVTFTNSEDVM